MRPCNVLITAASRRGPLVQAFQAALRDLGIPGAVVATDVSAYSPAVHVADRAYRVPLASDPDYIEEILGLCESEGISLFVPTIDDELPVCGAAIESFLLRGVFPACSSLTTALVCNDKYATCARLRRHGIPAAVTWLPGELPPVPRFPLFIKPRGGRGAVGAYTVRDARELAFFLEYVERPILQEYLDGPEYTIDVLCDPAGTPLSIVPRERVVIRSGVIDRGRTVKSDELIRLAERVCAAIPFVGPLNVQCRMHAGVPAIFEINPRFSGGIPLTIAAGADFPRMLVSMARGVSVPPRIGDFRGDLWISKFESAVFVPGSGLELPPVPMVGSVVSEVA
jgi:carbamoyl-phosphate synthase large subunit